MSYWSAMPWMTEGLPANSVHSPILIAFSMIDGLGGGVRGLDPQRADPLLEGLVHLVDVLDRVAAVDDQALVVDLRSFAAIAAASLRPLKYSFAAGTKYANEDGTGGFCPTVVLGAKGEKSFSDVFVFGVPKPAAADADAAPTPPPTPMERSTRPPTAAPRRQAAAEAGAAETLADAPLFEHAARNEGAATNPAPASRPRSGTVSGRPCRPRSTPSRPPPG